MSGNASSEMKMSSPPGLPLLPTPPTSSPAFRNSVSIALCDPGTETPIKRPAFAAALFHLKAKKREVKYPVDGLYTSRLESKRIMAMPECERKRIMRDRRRHAVQDSKQRKQQIRNMTAKQEQERKAMVADLEDGEIREAPSIKTETASPCTSHDELKCAHEAANGYFDGKQRLQVWNYDDRRLVGHQHQFPDRDINRHGCDNYHPGEDASQRCCRIKDRRPTVREGMYHDRSPRRYDRSWPRNGSWSPKPDSSKQSTTLRDFENAQIGRSQLGQHCGHPRFEECVIGAYCRVSIPCQGHGQSTYRMARLKGLTKGKPYEIWRPQSSNMNTVTDTYAVLSYGKSVTTKPFSFISDRSFTKAEFLSYKEQCMLDGITMPRCQTLSSITNDVATLFKKNGNSQALNNRFAKHDMGKN